MAYKNGYRLWDDEYKQAHWTPEELAESNDRVARIGNIINAEHNGKISHDEAMIRQLMLDPDLLENMLDDAYGASEQVKRVCAWGKEAKNRTRENRYWASLLRHAQKTVQKSYKLSLSFTLSMKPLALSRPLRRREHRYESDCPVIGLYGKTGSSLDKYFIFWTSKNPARNL